MNKPRNPWIAGVLTLLTIGLGHIYAGAAKKGIVLFVIPQIILLGVLVPLFIFAPNVTGMIVTAVVIAAFLGFAVFCIVDAVRIARKGGKDYFLKKYNRRFTFFIRG